MYLNGAGGNVSVPSASNLVVGATGPDSGAKLNVKGGAAKFNGTTNHSWFNYSTAEHTYIRGGKTTSEVFINDNSAGNVSIGYGGGNVGIGTITPAYDLHVSGDVGGTVGLSGVARCCRPCQHSTAPSKSVSWMRTVTAQSGSVSRTLRDDVPQCASTAGQGVPHGFGCSIRPATRARKGP